MKSETKNTKKPQIADSQQVVKIKADYIIRLYKSINLPVENAIKIAAWYSDSYEQSKQIEDYIKINFNK